MSTIPTEPVLCRALTGRLPAPPGQTGPVVSILTFPTTDLARDWVRPDGGDWSRYPASPLVNWAHGIPIGRGQVEHKLLEFQGKTTTVAQGTTEFFSKAADLDGLNLTEYDNPNDRNPVGRYTASECLRAAADSEALVRANIATGVSIEFTPAGPKGTGPNDGAYWDLPGESPICPRPPRHFERWVGHAYAHARLPVNPGCRTLLDDQAEVIEKAIRVAQTGRLPGGTRLCEHVMKAFRDAETLLPLVRGEGKGEVVRGGWESPVVDDTVDELERQLEEEMAAAGVDPDSLEEYEVRAEPISREAFYGKVRKAWGAHPGGSFTGEFLRDRAGLTDHEVAHARKQKWLVPGGAGHELHPSFSTAPGGGSWMDDHRNAKSFDIFAHDLTLPGYEVRAEGRPHSDPKYAPNLGAEVDRSSFGPAATRARELSTAALHAMRGTPVAMQGARSANKFGGTPPAAGSIGAMVHSAYGHSKDGNYRLAGAAHEKAAARLRTLADTLPPDSPHFEALHGAARAHEQAAEANHEAHGVVNYKPKTTTAQLIRQPKPRTPPREAQAEPVRDLFDPGTGAGPAPKYQPRSVGHDVRPYGRPFADEGSKNDKWSSDRTVVQNALTASKKAYHASSHRDNAEAAGGHRDLLTAAWQHHSEGPGWGDSRTAMAHHTALHRFHDAESTRLAALGDSAGSSAHQDAARKNLLAVQAHARRVGPPSSANHMEASFNYSRPSGLGLGPRGLRSFDHLPTDPTEEIYMADPAVYAGIANTASRLAFKMGRTGENYAEAKSLPEHRVAAVTHDRHSTQFRAVGNVKAADAHARAAEMHRRAAGVEVKAGDPGMPSFANAGQDDGPPVGVQAFLNLAQLLQDGAEALMYDIKRSDSEKMLMYAKATSETLRKMAGDLAGRMQKYQSKLGASGQPTEAGGGEGSEDLLSPDSPPGTGSEAKALDAADLRADGSIVVKSYDNWTPRRFPLSALKDLPGKTAPVQGPAEAPVVKSTKTSEELARDKVLNEQLAVELERAALLRKRAGEVVEALANR